jgi:hypothetical protein
MSNWYRLTLGPNGSILTCVQVEETTAADSAFVMYVSADSESSARLKAPALYVARQRAAVRKRRDENFAKGLCRCGGVRNPAHLRCCPRCREVKRNGVERKKLRSSGVEVPSSLLESLNETKEKRQDEHRLAILMEVRNAWLKAVNMDAFARWLCKEIVELGGKAK